ncbi:MAG: AMP-binding protein, partial [Cyanobacteria bacterium P01_G01_bin.38]
MSSPTITGFRLSPQQRQIWQRSEGERGALPAQCLLTIQGDLRPPWLKKALQEIVEQHEIFRTAFQQTPGIKLPLQVIQSPGEIVWRAIDLSTAEVADPAAAIRTAQTTEQHRVNPSEPPCLRCILFKLGSQDHRLLLTLPALCADTQTYQIVLRQLSQRYGAASPWANDEPIQYAEFAEWQNQLLSETDETALAAQAFWQQQGLASHSALLPPLRYRHTQKPSFTPQVHQVDIAAEVAIALQSEFSTPAVLLTSWLCLLWRQTEQPEIAIGVAGDGRQDEALVQVCGPLTRFLPLQCDLAGATPFSALLRRVEQTWHDLILWQDYLPQDLPDSLVTLPVSFEFLNPVTATTPDGIKFTLDRTWVYPDRPDLKLTAVQRDERLNLEIHYNETVLSAAAIAALATQLDALLNHVSRQPAATLDTLSLSNRTQQVIQDPLRGSPRSSRDLPPRWPPRCLHQRFEQQAEQTPERVALIVEDQRLTYRELNRRANQLAHHLQQLGAGPEVIVALYLERSPELLITLLAILKAGSAYLPLDPTWPASRVTCQLKDAKAPILVTQQQLLSHGIEGPDQVVCLGRDRAGLLLQSTANPMSAVTPANLAYILYTSGSTGQPKGVAVEHRQLLTYIDSVIERLELPAAAHYAIVSTLAADLGQTMLFPCWYQGGTLHLMTPDRARDAKALSEYAQQQPIDCLKIVPSHLQALLQTSHPQSLLPRQRLVLGGEACPWTLIEQVQQLAPNCRSFNHYGPTETTVGVLT